MPPQRKRARIANKSIWVLSDVLPDVVVREIFSKLTELPERIKLRAVCRQWYWLVESSCKSLRYVQLHLSHRTVARGPPNTIQRFLFERSWNEPQMDPIAKCACTIREMSMNPQLIQYFVSMFKQVHTLVLYFDLLDTATNIGYFEQLLEGLTELDSFSFIQCHFLLNVSRVCSVVEKRAPYTRLDLCFRPYPRGHLSYGRAAGCTLKNATQLVNHFNVSYELTNYAEIMSDVGWVHAEARRLGTDKLIPHHTPAVTSLSVQCTLNPQELSRAFGQNCQLSQVRQLQLYLITSLNSVQNHLLHFKNVERLTLFYLSQTSQAWTNEWIKSIGTLPRLTELVLVNFVPDPVMSEKELTNIRKLTIGTFNLFAKIQQHVTVERSFTRTEETFNAFVCFIWIKFPQIEELNIFSYDDAIYEDTKDHLEEYLKLLNPQLRLNINLRDRNLIDHL